MKTTETWLIAGMKTKRAQLPAKLSTAGNRDRKRKALQLRLVHRHRRQTVREGQDPNQSHGTGRGGDCREDLQRLGTQQTSKRRS
jgi:hypothetical protein